MSLEKLTLLSLDQTDLRSNINGAAYKYKWSIDVKATALASMLAVNASLKILYLTHNE